MAEITARVFEEKVGSPSHQDDLERSNCFLVGMPGHYQCGWCKQHDKPRFLCGCFARVKEGESFRIHRDWWGKCRTCKHWAGDRGMQLEGESVPEFLTRRRDNRREQPPRCGCSKSDLFGQETWTDGHCSEWDSFDFETAFMIMQEDE